MTTEYRQLTIDFSDSPESVVDLGVLVEPVESEPRFPTEVPEHIYIFAPGTKIYNNEGSPMGVVGNKRKPDGSKEDFPLVAVCISDKMVRQKPLFSCLGMRKVFKPGSRPDSNYLTLGGEYVLFRVARGYRLRDEKRSEAWNVWVREMKTTNTSLKDLETNVKSRVGKRERYT